MHPRLLLLPLLGLLGCPKRTPDTPDSLLAALVDERGRAVGHVEARTGSRGVDITARVYALPRQSRFVLRVHAGSACTGHTFSDAGPPWTPAGASGPTTLGPLVPDDRGRAVLNASDPALTLAGVRNGLNGHAIVLARVGQEPLSRACGVFGPPPDDEAEVQGDQPQITDAFEI